MNKAIFFKILYIVAVLFFLHKTGLSQKNNGEVILKFQYMANGKPLILGDTNYVNAFSESYAVTRLKFYISNINLASKDIFLVDVSKEDSIKIPVQPGEYSTLFFTLGVDSILNCSGAQDGALDPMNGMFWTWNSGYIFFKMEGYSPSSTADLNRIEHHIGGYQGANKAARKIELDLQQPLVVKANQRNEITIRIDLDKYWQGNSDIRIATNALIMVPGELAKKSADNFAGMFSAIEIK